MEKKIRTELLKMSGIMLVLVGLGIYAHEFVISGIKAKMALNLSIFALFGVAAWLGFAHVFDLKNEVIALKALKANYDLRGARRTPPVDMSKPAVVFHEPELLGEGYRLISEELGKQADLQLSNATVQTLLHDIDLRINDRKSTLIYFSGLMVFLGLLGAFMGLMKTVHSVSDLIGSMDMSGSGGTDAFGKMIEGMKAPLSGMSVGFSSSLFGLMTSMVLGALERCMSSAMKALRNDFEHWISRLAALEGGANEGGTSLADDRQLRRVLESGVGQLRDLRDVVTTNAKLVEAGQQRIDALQDALFTMTSTVEKMTETIATLADPHRALAPIAEAIERLAAHQADVLSDVQSLHAEAAADRENLHGLVNVLELTLERLQTVDGPELHQQLDRIITLHLDRLDGPAANPAQSMGGETEPAQPPRGLWGMVSQWHANRRLMAGLHSQTRQVAALKREVEVALSGNQRVMRGAGRSLGQRLDRMENGRDRDRRQIERLAYLAQSQREDLAALRNQIAAQGGEAAAPYTGGRALMQSLRKRLNADFETTPPPSLDRAAGGSQY